MSAEFIAVGELIIQPALNSAKARKLVLKIKPTRGNVLAEIGRAKDCEISFNRFEVAQRHCRLSYEDQSGSLQVFLSDLTFEPNSVRLVRVNGEVLTSPQVPLHHEDTFSLCGKSFKFHSLLNTSGRLPNTSLAPSPPISVPVSPSSVSPPPATTAQQQNQPHVNFAQSQSLEMMPTPLFTVMPQSPVSLSPSASAVQLPAVGTPSTPPSSMPIMTGPSYYPATLPPGAVNSTTPMTPPHHNIMGGVAAAPSTWYHHSHVPPPPPPVGYYPIPHEQQFAMLNTQLKLNKQEEQIKELTTQVSKHREDKTEMRHKIEELTKDNRDYQKQLKSTRQDHDRLLAENFDLKTRLNLLMDERIHRTAAQQQKLWSSLSSENISIHTSSNNSASNPIISDINLPNVSKAETVVPTCGGSFPITSTASTTQMDAQEFAETLLGSSSVARKPKSSKVLYAVSNNTGGSSTVDLCDSVSINSTSPKRRAMRHRRKSAFSPPTIETALEPEGVSPIEGSIKKVTEEVTQPPATEFSGGGKRNKSYDSGTVVNEKHSGWHKNNKRSRVTLTFTDKQQQFPVTMKLKEEEQSTSAKPKRTTAARERLVAATSNPSSKEAGATSAKNLGSSISKKQVGEVEAQYSGEQLRQEEDRRKRKLEKRQHWFEGTIEGKRHRKEIVSLAKVISSRVSSSGKLPSRTASARSAVSQRRRTSPNVAKATRSGTHTTATATTATTATTTATPATATAAAATTAATATATATATAEKHNENNNLTSISINIDCLQFDSQNSASDTSFQKQSNNLNMQEEGSDNDDVEVQVDDSDDDHIHHLLAFGHSGIERNATDRNSNDIYHNDSNCIEESPGVATETRTICHNNSIQDVEPADDDADADADVDVDVDVDVDADADDDSDDDIIRDDDDEDDSGDNEEHGGKFAENTCSSVQEVCSDSECRTSNCVSLLPADSIMDDGSQIALPFGSQSNPPVASPLSLYSSIPNTVIV